MARSTRPAFAGTDQIEQQAPHDREHQAGVHVRLVFGHPEPDAEVAQQQQPHMDELGKKSAAGPRPWSAFT